MQRGNESSGGLGPQLVGEKINVNHRNVAVLRLLGEGGFSFVYLVKDISENNGDGGNHHHSNNISSVSSRDAAESNGEKGKSKENGNYVLKITSIHSRQQRDIAEKEAKLLGRLSHPSIVRMVGSCYRTTTSNVHDHGNKPHMKLGSIIGGGSGGSSSSGQGGSGSGGHRPQHLILMEYCEGGTAMSVCNNLKANKKHFDLPSLIIAFGQICNAVSYLHAQRPPIVHRDLKPVNFLVKNGAYKLCDFGSAVFGHVDLKTARARTEAEEVIEKTTTQMFRSPEMVDLYMSKKLTQSTDVWALGCCLYSLAFLQNCFEEGSNLAILSRNYKIPENNPYGDGLVELIDRMLTVDCKERADMTEVILCLSAIYSNRPLPARKVTSKEKKSRKNKNATQESERVGSYRTDGQGIVREPIVEEKKPVSAKKLNPNSAAARRREAAKNTATDMNPTNLSKRTNSFKKSDSFDQPFSDFQFIRNASSEGEAAFSGSDDPFQIGEGSHGANRFSSFKKADVDEPPHEEGFEFPRGEVPFPTDADLNFSNFGLDDNKKGHYSKKEIAVDTSGILRDLVHAPSEGAYREETLQKSRKKRGGIVGLFSKADKNAETEV